MPAFIPGLQLSGQFYAEAVRPILDAEFPGLSHTACRIGAGSEVLGFDTEMSRDHDWGPKLDLFLRMKITRAAWRSPQRNSESPTAPRLSRIFDPF